MNAFTPRSVPVFVVVVTIVLVASVPVVETTTPTHSSHDSVPVEPVNGNLDPVDESADSGHEPSSTRFSSDRTIALAEASPVPSVVFAAGYSRYDDSDPLDHETRADVHEAIRLVPGSYVGELQETTEVPRSTLRYHLRILEEERLVYSETILGNLRYYPIGSDASEIDVALENDATAAVLQSIARLEPASVSTVAADLSRSPSTVSYHLDRLADANLIERERDGEAVRTQLTPDARSALGPDSAPSAPVGAHLAED